MKKQRKSKESLTLIDRFLLALDDIPTKDVIQARRSDATEALSAYNMIRKITTESFHDLFFQILSVKRLDVRVHGDSALFTTMDESIYTDYVKAVATVLENKELGAPIMVGMLFAPFKDEGYIIFVLYEYYGNLRVITTKWDSDMTMMGLDSNTYNYHGR